MYNEAEFSHRIVIVTEADSLPEDGPAASAVRSIMSDREMSYEVVEKGKDGAFHVRKIVKAGPTGLMTTSTKSLGDQASTRTLTISISDSAEQTKLVLHAQADRANGDLKIPDLSAWVALQRWLELSGERRVVIPFAQVLADTLPHSAVRMRRDFPQLLTVIQTITVLHQLLRERDGQGRIIATVDDYAEARRLLEDVFTTTVGEGITTGIRETVEAVGFLSKGGAPVTEQQLVGQLGLAKSTIHYRVLRGIQGGWLINKTTQKRAPAQLVLGSPLPDGCPLPAPDDLFVCVKDPQKHSNRSNPSSATGKQSWPDRGFERIEPIPGGSTHTEGEDMWNQGHLPLDQSGEAAESDGWWAGEL